MRHAAHRCACLVVALWLWLAGAPTVLGGRADAQPANPQQTAVAQALVDEAHKLMDSGRLDEACPKLKEAARILSPRGSAALAQLAECYEKAGHLASATGTWVEVENTERSADNVVRADYARKKITELEPRLPKLTIVVPESLRAQGRMEITQDGAPLGQAQWGLPIPVDPGRHTVRIAVMKRGTFWQSEIDVVAGENVRLLVPQEHENAPVVPAQEPPQSPARPPDPVPVVEKPAPVDDPGKVRRGVEIALGSAGIVALEVAGVFLGVTLAKEADYETVCSNQTSCNRVLDDAIKMRTAAIVSGVVGAAALAGGIALHATAPAWRRGLARAPPYAPALVFAPAGVAMRVRW